MQCEEARRRILEVTLDGVPIPQERPLGQHLLHCAECQALLVRLGQVDSALRAMPLEAAPAGISRRIMQEVKASAEKPFLPWNVWLPAFSLLVGLAVVYLTLLWQRAVDITPAVTSWPAQIEVWVGGHQEIFGTVGLSIALGLLFSFVGIGLGLYVGRVRAAAGR